MRRAKEGPEKSAVSRNRRRRNRRRKRPEYTNGDRLHQKPGPRFLVHRKKKEFSTGGNPRKLRIPSSLFSRISSCSSFSICRSCPKSLSYKPTHPICAALQRAEYFWVADPQARATAISCRLGSMYAGGDPPPVKVGLHQLRLPDGSPGTHKFPNKAQRLRARVPRQKSRRQKVERIGYTCIEP